MPENTRRFWEVTSGVTGAHVLVLAENEDEAGRLAVEAGLKGDSLAYKPVDNPPSLALMPPPRRFDVLITRNGASFPGPIRYVILAYSAESATNFAVEQYRLDHLGFPAEHVRLETEDGVPAEIPSVIVPPRR